MTRVPLLHVRQTSCAGVRYYADGKRISEDAWRRLEHAQAMTWPDRHPEHRDGTSPRCPACVTL